MSGKAHAYLDLAARPAVGDMALDPRPAWVFRGDGSAIVWANPAGVAFLGERTLGTLLARRLPRTAPLAAEIARLATQLPPAAARIEILRFNLHVRQVAVAAACRRVPAGARADLVLAVSTAAVPAMPLAAQAAELVRSLAWDGSAAAVLDDRGAVVAASPGWEGAVPAAVAADLAAEARAAAAAVARRPAGNGVGTAGAVRLGASVPAYVLVVAGPPPDAAGRPRPRLVASQAAAGGTPSNVVRLPMSPFRALPGGSQGNGRDARPPAADAGPEEGAAAGPAGSTAACHARTAAAGPDGPATADGSMLRLLDRLPVGIAIYRESEILFANRAILDLLGYGEAAEFAAAGGPEVVLGEEALAAVRGRARPGLVEVRRRDGGTVAATAVLHAIPLGRSPALLLSLAPGAPPKELVAARRAAEAANALKSEFLARVSHEIRTPLNAILGFADLMIEERFGPVGSDRYRGYLRDIRLSGTHLLSLVNDLLDLSKVEAGQLELVFEPVPVNEVVRELVALMQPLADRERIVMRTALASGLPDVVADRRSLRQILLNILSNAVRFTPAGGQVTAGSAAGAAGEVVLRVRDTGIGMSAEDLEIAMKPFRRLATKGHGEGTGLGLPLTKALVEANGATLVIDSAPGQGTLVRVVFPVVRTPSG